MSTAAPPEKPPERPDDEERRERYLTLVEHLQELRYRLTVCAIAVVLGVAISTYFGNDLIEFLKKPGEARSDTDLQLQFIEPFELFGTYFRVALLGGLALAMPVIVYQVLAFASPGLKANEKRWIYGTVLAATALFFSGLAFSYYVALPPALDFLLDPPFGEGLAEPNIRIGSYIDFVTRLLFWSGVSFETPLVVMFLARFQIVSAGQLLRWWRYALVAAFVIAAVVTPTWDPITQTVVAGPIIVLYGLGILLAFFVQPRSR
ncbi:MAG TPA: twin-arginine translocase subunit TatC [Dehalococcoidia bacterium]|jgi:sec-independent protein translocase protein TatC|nr:twin-arginine translocase subunit TatC [Dehalococcoidia bacterium]